MLAHEPQTGDDVGGGCGILVPDFWRPYFTRVGVLHALCTAPHLRELKALREIEKAPWARARHRFLRQTCHAVPLARARDQEVSPRFRAWLEARYDRIVAHGCAFHEGPPPLVANGAQRRGRRRRRTGHNL